MKLKNIKGVVKCQKFSKNMSKKIDYKLGYKIGFGIFYKKNIFFKKMLLTKKSVPSINQYYL